MSRSHQPQGKGASLPRGALGVCALVAFCVFLAHRAVAAAVHVLPWVLLGLAAGAAAGVVVRLVVVVVRFARSSRVAKRNYPAAVWARIRWRWLARNAGLAYEDHHRRGRLLRNPFGSSVVVDRRGEVREIRVRYPRVRSMRVDEHGWSLTVKTVPGVGRKQAEDAVEHIGNSWGCARVSVTQPKPGRLVVRGLRTDPLLAPLEVTELPVFDGRNVYLGRDEHGQLRPVSLANHSGSCWAGNPGRGKTESALSLAWQLLPSPAVEVYILDGGELDWQPFADGATAYVTELPDVVDVLHDLAAGMNRRRRTLQADLGVRNAWHAGPSAEYPLRWIVMEEAPAFLQVVKGDKKREQLAEEAHALVAGLLRRGRAPMYHTSLITQKATTTGGLHPDLRDLCGLRWSFGVATTDGAASILGSDIREHPALSPVQLQGPEHVGVATCLLRTGSAPYTLLRFPHTGEQRADQLAADLAARKPSTKDGFAQLADQPATIPHVAA